MQSGGLYQPLVGSAAVADQDRPGTVASWRGQGAHVRAITVRERRGNQVHNVTERRCMMISVRFIMEYQAFCLLVAAAVAAYVDWSGVN